VPRGELPSLEEGGRLIVVDFKTYGMTWRNRASLCFRYFKTFGLPPRGSHNNLSPFQLTSFVERAQFHVRKIDLIGERTKVLYLRGKKENPLSSFLEKQAPIV